MDQLLFKINGLAYTYNIHWDGCCLTISLDLKGKDYQVTGNPCLKNFGYCTATFMYNTRFFPPNVLFLIFWNDCCGGFLAMKSSATTPFFFPKNLPPSVGDTPLYALYVDGRTKHEQIDFTVFATVSNYKKCHVCNWWFHFRENGTALQNYWTRTYPS